LMQPSMFFQSKNIGEKNFNYFTLLLKINAISNFFAVCTYK